MTALKQLIETAEFVRSEPVQKSTQAKSNRQVQQYHLLANSLMIGGNKRHVVLRIEEDALGNKHYNLNFDHTKDKTPIKGGYTQEVIISAPTKNRRDNTIAEAGEDVNIEDKTPIDDEVGREAIISGLTKNRRSHDVSQKDDLINVEFVDDLNDIRKPVDFKAAQTELEARLVEVKLSDKVRVKLVNDFYSLVTGQEVKTVVNKFNTLYYTAFNGE